MLFDLKLNKSYDNMFSSKRTEDGLIGDLGLGAVAAGRYTFTSGAL